MTESERRPRGALEAAVKRVCDAYVTGEYKVPDEKPLTPHRAAVALTQMDGLEHGPSSGAVDAVFKRWVEIGFIEPTAHPFRFTDYTPAGREQGLAALHLQWATTMRSTREAAKAAERAAKADAGAVQ